MWYRCYFLNNSTGKTFSRDIRNPDFSALRATFSPTFLYAERI